jgi:THO complex subunit 5
MILYNVLSQANRSILLEEDRVKAETERAKAPVDFTTLQLHNLMYEKSHYVKAIKACKDFRSKYPDIDLVSEEEFFRDAPEEIKAKTLSNDSAHNLMMQRLQFELFQVLTPHYILLLLSRICHNFCTRTCLYQSACWLS